jgi:hypothetical protein
LLSILQILAYVDPEPLRPMESCRALLLRDPSHYSPWLSERNIGSLGLSVILTALVAYGSFISKGRTCGTNRDMIFVSRGDHRSLVPEDRQARPLPDRSVAGDYACPAYQFALDAVRVTKRRNHPDLSPEELSQRVTRRMPGDHSLGKRQALARCAPMVAQTRQVFTRI